MHLPGKRVTVLNVLVGERYSGILVVTCFPLEFVARQMLSADDSALGL